MMESTIRPMLRAPSANTRTGWISCGKIPSCMPISFISWPRYWVTRPPLACSIRLAGIVSSLATRCSGTAWRPPPAPARNSSMGTCSSEPDVAGDASTRVSAAARAAMPALRATPFGSRIMITEPSPRMVLPLNIVTCRRIGATGLTTISSVSNTSSTMMPSLVLPTVVTTTVVSARGGEAAWSRRNRFDRRTSGSSSSRRRSTSAPATCSTVIVSRAPGLSADASPVRPAAGAFGPTLTSSRTAICGIAKRSPPAATRTAEMMARVSGIFTVKQEPAPGVLASSIVPPMRSMLARTTSMPTPRPEIEVTASAVEKPARKMKARIWASVIADSSASVARPWASALARTRATSMPRPSSLISMRMWPPSW